MKNIIAQQHVKINNCNAGTNILKKSSASYEEKVQKKRFTICAGCNMIRFGN